MEDKIVHNSPKQIDKTSSQCLSLERVNNKITEENVGTLEKEAMGNTFNIQSHEDVVVTQNSKLS